MEIDGQLSAAPTTKVVSTVKSRYPGTRPEKQRGSMSLFLPNGEMATRHHRSSSDSHNRRAMRRWEKSRQEERKETRGERGRKKTSARYGAGMSAVENSAQFRSRVPVTIKESD